VFAAGVSVITLGSFAPCIANYRRDKVSRSRQVDTEMRHLSPQRSSSIGDTMPISDYQTKEWNFSDPLHLLRVGLEEHGIAPWTETNTIPVPIEHQKEFRIPWLTRKRGITFWLENTGEELEREKDTALTLGDSLRSEL
jgi:hypothetical protein